MDKCEEVDRSQVAGACSAARVVTQNGVVPGWHTRDLISKNTNMKNKAVVGGTIAVLFSATLIAVFLVYFLLVPAALPVK